MSFKELKKKRSGAIERMLNAYEKESGGGGGYSPDERFWQPTVDKAGNGYSIIRFLPCPEDNDLEWAKYYSHSFKGPTGLWYIENSRTTFGWDHPDPVAEMNNRLWSMNDNENCPLKKLVRSERKRRLHYVSNIMVIKDDANPQNEGKVFLFKYGKKIHDKIKGVMKPEFEDETAIDPFDFWEGANFKLKIRKVEGYRNYDRSEFDSPSALSDDDEYLETVYNSLYDLREFTDPKNFKSYDELKEKLNKVLGETSTEAAADAVEMEAAPAVEPELGEEVSPSKLASVVDDDDETMSYFESLAAED